MEMNAADGCELCRLFRQALLCQYSTMSQEDALLQCPWPVIIVIADTPRSINVRVQSSSTSSEDSEDSETLVSAFLMITQELYELKPYQGRIPHHDKQYRLKILAAPSMPFAPNADDLQELMSNWIRTCTQSHHRCVSGGYQGGSQLSVIHKSDLPSRLICVNVNGGNPFLVSTTSWQQGQYICLSYCWGTGNILKATKDTLATLSTNGFSLDACPQTIKDAILITRRLGVEYLWIDALCILQDDREDWARESSNMAKIYQNALVTLAAESSTSSTGGLLIERQILKYPTTRSHLFWDPLVNQPTGHLLEPAQSSWPKSVLRAPLQTRGWTLQERLMAPRILHFTKNGVFWECGALIAAEDTQTGIANTRLLGESVSSPRKAKIDEHILDITAFMAERPSREEIDLWWFRVARVAASRDLTYHTDKLVALSGVARMLEVIYSVEIWSGNPIRYWAGIWDVSVLEGLSWIPVLKVVRDEQSHQRHLPSKRYTSYVAPSWSWASMDGSIAFGQYVWQGDERNGQSHRQISTHPHTPLLKVRDCHVVTVGSDPYGQISSATMFVSGVLSQWLQVGRRVSDNRPPNFRDLYARNTSDQNMFQYYEIRYDDQRSDLHGGQSRLVEGEKPHERLPGHVAEVYCLRIFEDVGWVKGRKKGIGALALSKIVGTDNQYRRVGWVHVYDPAWFEGRVEQEILLV